MVGPPKFKRFLELVLKGSGGLFEPKNYAVSARISLPMVKRYLRVLEKAGVVSVIRPYRSSPKTASTPKVYARDADAARDFKGEKRLDPAELGYLWEHTVLNEIHKRAPGLKVYYWRDPHGYEIDFVLAPRGKPPIAVECKRSSNNIETRSLVSFRQAYSMGENWAVLQDATYPFKRSEGRPEWDCIGLPEFIRRVEQLSR